MAYNAAGANLTPIAGAGFDLHALNSDPTALFGDGAALYALDRADRRVYAYGRLTGLRETASEFVLHADNADPAGLWGDGAVFWVGDAVDDKFYAYRAAGGARAPALDIAVQAGNDRIGGVWGDGSRTLYATDRDDARVYRYALPYVNWNSLARAGNDNPVALWGDAATLWAADDADNRLYAYRRGDQARLPASDLTLHADNADPAGLWGDAATIRVSDAVDGRVYAYTRATGARAMSSEFALHADNAAPRGIWSDGTTLWAADHADRKIYAYALAGGARQPARDLTLHASNTDPAGLWSNGTILWVGDRSGSKAYAYSLSRRAASPANDIAGAAAGAAMTGLWGQGTMLWSADDAGDRIHAHMLPTADFMNLGANGNFDPSAVWAGTTTLWIADSAAGAVYGYSRAAMRPDAAQNFPAATLRAAGNVNPTGLWSDGTYLYVSDATTDRVYVYRLDTKARVAAREFALDAAVNGAPAGLHGDGAGAGGGVLWVADRVSDRLYAYDLTAGSVGARLSTRDVPLAGGNGDPTGLWGDGTTFWAADGVDGKAYAYSRAARRPAPALDLALTGNAAPAGFWADAAGAAGGTAYSADSVNDRLGNYALPARNYNLNDPAGAGVQGSHGLWSDGTTLFLADSGSRVVRAYDLSTQATSTGRGIDNATLVNAGVWRIRGMTGHGSVIWISEFLDNHIYAFVYSGGSWSRDLTREFPAAMLRAAGHTDLRGIWTDGTTMWSVDSGGRMIRAFNIATKARDQAKDLTIPAGGGNPEQIWSDGTTMWVAYFESGGTPVSGVRAFNLATGAAVPGSDLSPATLRAGAGGVAYTPVGGVWSDGATIWVADAAAQGVYDYPLPAINFGDLSLTGNADITGLWSDGTTTLWAADGADRRLYAYGLSTQARRDARDAALDAANADPYGLWSDGAVMWVADTTDGRLYAYDLTATGTPRLPARDVALHASNSAPTGVWSDGAVLWAADRDDGRLYAYDRSATGTPRLPARDLDTGAHGNASPGALWSDGTILWVMDTADRRVYGYRLADGARDPGKDLGALAAGHDRPTGMWSDGDVLWVGDRDDARLYRYTLPDFDFASLGDAGNDDPRALWSDGRSVMWIADGAGHKLYAWHPAHQNRLPARDIDLTTAPVSAPVVAGLWSDGTTVWAADPVSFGARLYAWNAATGAYEPARNIALHAANANAAGVWSDGSVLYVLDSADRRVYAYAVGTYARNTAREFVLHASNSAPSGLWGDRNALWVGDAGAGGRAYAYNRADGARAAGKDAVYAAGNADPGGLWSDGRILYVSDRVDDRLYEYRLQSVGFSNLAGAGNADPRGLAGLGAFLYIADDADDAIYAYGSATQAPAPPFNIASSTLTAAGNLDPRGLWAGAGLLYAVDSADTYVYAYDLSTRAHNAGAGFDLHADNADPTGLWSNEIIAWVADAADGRLYAYRRAGGARLTSAEFALHADNAAPAGVWSNGTTIWVMDADDDRAYAYLLAGGARRPGKDLALGAANADPWGFWSDGTTAQVGDTADARLYEYVLPNIDFARLTGSGNDDLTALESDGTTMWLLDRADDKIYAYHRRNENRLPDRDFDNLIGAGNADPAGLARRGNVMYVADAADRRVYAYDLTGGARLAVREFALAASNSDPAALHAAGDLLYVADAVDNRVYAYDVSGAGAGVPAPARDFSLAASNTDPAGMAGDGYIVWVLDRADGRAYAYRRADGTPLPWRDLTGWAAAGNDAPRGLYIDSRSLTYYAGDDADDRLYSYTRASDFNTLELHGNARPRLISGAGDTTLIVNRLEKRVYAYDLSTEARRPAQDLSEAVLAAAGITGTGNNSIRGLAAAGDIVWVADDSGQIAAVNRTTGLRDPRRSIASATAVAAGNANIRYLWSDDDGDYIYASDPDDRRVYAYNLTTRTYDPARSWNSAQPRQGAIWSDGILMWVMDPGVYNAAPPRIHAYFLATGRPSPAHDVDAAVMRADGNITPRGLWGRGAELLVTGSDTNRAHRYPAPDRLHYREDFAGLAAAGNNAPKGVWSNGVHMYVVNDAATGSDRIFVYDRSDRSRAAGLEFNLDAANSRPAGLWGDGAVLLVSDAGAGGGRLYAYDRAGGARNAARDLTLDAANSSPAGVWSDGSAVWVADAGGAGSAGVYAYAAGAGGGARRPELDLPRAVMAAAGNDHPAGMWSDGRTLFIADRQDHQVYAYDLHARIRDADRDLTVLPDYGNTAPWGLWSDRSLMWVGNENPRLHAYPTPSSALSHAIPLGGLGYNPEYLWSAAGTTFRVSDPTAAAVRAFTSAAPAPGVATATAVAAPRLDLTGLAAHGNADPAGVWSDGVDLYVADRADRRVYVYNLTTAARNAAREIVLSPLNLNPAGVWGDAGYLYVADRGRGAGSLVFAYNRTTRAWHPARDLPRSADNAHPTGLWGDGHYLYIADDEDDKIYAWRTDTRVRAPERDLDDLDAAGNNAPAGFWSDGRTAWVADADDDVVYVYHMFLLSAPGSVSAAVSGSLAPASGGGYAATGSASFALPQAGRPGATARVVTGLTACHGDGSGCAATDNAAVSRRALPGANSWSWTQNIPAGRLVTLYAAASHCGAAGVAATATVCAAVATATTAAFRTAAPPENARAGIEFQDTSSLTATSAVMLTAHWDYPAVAPAPDGFLVAGVYRRCPADSGGLCFVSNINARVSGSLRQWSVASGATRAGDRLTLTLTLTAVIDAPGVPSSAAGAAVSAAVTRVAVLDGLSAAGNDAPIGVWAATDTIWVSDRDDARVYAYNPETKARQTDQEIGGLGAVGNSNPAGIAVANGIMYVLDTADVKVYAYNLNSAGREHLPGRDIDALLTAGNSAPAGMTTDGATTLWISDRNSRHIYAYSLSTGQRSPALDLDGADLTAAGAAAPYGIAARDSFLWVADHNDDYIYAFTRAAGDRARPLDIADLPARGNSDPLGIALRSDSVWVVDAIDAVVYRYPIPRAAVDLSGLSLTLTQTGTSSPYGVAAAVSWRQSVPPSPTYRVGFSAVRCERLGTGCVTATATPAYATGTAFSWTPPLTLTVGQTVNVTVRVAGCDAARLNCSADATAFQFRSIRSVNAIPDFIFIETSQLGARAPYALHAAVSWRSINNPSPRYRSGGTIQHCPADGSGCIDVVVPTAYATGASRSILPPALRVSDGDRVYIVVNVAGCSATDNEDCSGSIITQRALTVSPKLPAPVNLTATVTPVRAAGQGINAGGGALVIRAAWHDRHAVPDLELNRLGLPDAPAAGDYRGAWSDGVHLWVAQAGPTATATPRLLAYDSRVMTRAPAYDFTMAASNADPAGIWSNGAAMYVLDAQDRRLYAYDAATRSPDPARDVDLNAALPPAAAPGGFWSDNAHFYISDSAGGTILAFTGAGARDAARDLAAPGNDRPLGLGSDGSVLWVGNASTTHVNAYRLDGGVRIPEMEFALAATGARDIWVSRDASWFWTAASGSVQLLSADPADPPVYRVNGSAVRCDASGLCATDDLDNDFTAERSYDWTPQLNISGAGTTTVSVSVTSCNLTNNVCAELQTVSFAYSANALASAPASVDLSFARSVGAAPWQPTLTARWLPSLSSLPPRHRIAGSVVHCPAAAGGAAGGDCATATLPAAFLATGTTAAFALPLFVHPGDTLTAAIRVAGCNAAGDSCSADIIAALSHTVTRAAGAPGGLSVTIDQTGADPPYGVTILTDWEAPAAAPPAAGYRVSGSVRYCDAAGVCAAATLEPARTGVSSSFWTPPLLLAAGAVATVTVRVAGCDRAGGDADDACPAAAAATATAVLTVSASACRAAINGGRRVVLGQRLPLSLSVSGGSALRSAAWNAVPTGTATVTPRGLVTGLSAGAATVTAAVVCRNGGRDSANHPVTVVATASRGLYAFDDQGSVWELPLAATAAPVLLNNPAVNWRAGAAAVHNDNVYVLDLTNRWLRRCDPGASWTCVRVGEAVHRWPLNSGSEGYGGLYSHAGELYAFPDGRGYLADPRSGEFQNANLGVFMLRDAAVAATSSVWALGYRPGWNDNAVRAVNAGRLPAIAAGARLSGDLDDLTGLAALNGRWYVITGRGVVYQFTELPGTGVSVNPELDDTGIRNATLLAYP